MKKMSVKSALVALVIMLISVSAFAVDFSASTNLGADLWGTNGFVLNNTNQKDSDLLTVSVSDEVWGSYFRFYTQAANDSPVTDRSISIWVKPIPVLKITVGSIGSGLYTEQLDWYRVPNAASISNKGWASDTATSGSGINFELTAIENLWILAGISPGFNALMANNAGNLEVGANTDFGVAAKYTIAGFGSIGAAYRNNGGATAGGTVTWNDMNFRVGLDFNAVPGLYAFLQAICRIDTGATTLSGVTIDEYIAYTAGDFYVKAIFPVTIRLTEVAGDNNYMTYDLKTGYTVMPNVTPFFRITQEAAIDLTNVTIAPALQFGADYSLGKVGFSTAVKINVPAVAGADITWSIPFSMRASW